MLRLVTILAIAVLASSSVIPSKKLRITPRSPVGQCPNPQGPVPVFLPDSERCDVYYECSNGAPVQNFCTAGLEWNPTLNTCDRPEQANCQAGKPKKAPKIIHPFSPVGECHGHEDGTPTYLPDSDNCKIYYECNNGIAVPNVCPDGLEWNEALHVCDFPEAANCQAGKPKKSPKAIHPFSPVGECHGHEDGTPTYLPDSDNCKIYYECNNGIAVQNVCPDGLEWNEALHVCDFPASANCQAGKPKKSPKAIHPFSPVGECHGHEGGTPTYLPDSNDCQIYYECSNGVPFQNVCPGDLQWSTVLNTCDYPNVVKCNKCKGIQPVSIVGECPIPQGPIPVYLPDDQDCSAFYECSNGVPIKLYCAPGTLFDSDYRRCVMASQAKCQTRLGC